MVSTVQLQHDIDCLVKHIPSSNSVTMGIFLDVGLPFEGQDQGGISHFLEHMCFRGTKNRTAYQITKEVDALGGSINAYTSKEYTGYYITVLPEHTVQGLDILADIVFHSQHKDPDVVLEKSIIAEEIKMYEDTPDDKILDMLNAQLFNGSYLGAPILGTQDSINTFNSTRLRDFYQHYFLPENIKIVVAGKVDDESKVVGHINHALSSVNMATSQTKRASGEPQFKFGEYHESKPLEQHHVCMGFPSIQYNHPDRYAVTLLAIILGGSMSSRLFQSVREKEGLAYSIYSTASFYRDTGGFTVYAGTSTETLDKAVDCINTELHKIVDKGITEEEFIRSKQQLKGSVIINLEGSMAWVNWLGRQKIYNTGLASIADLEQLLDKVTLDDVRRITKNTLLDTKKMFVTLGQKN
jgi:predicted Zn-dependent peptidase